MTQAIDRPGTFRGKPLDWGVSETKNGFPQFVVRLQALEMYDEDLGQYIPWSEFDQEATGYLVLYTKKDEKWEELLNSKQIKKVFGWTGLDFQSLAEGKFGETIVLFRIEESVYNGSTTLKVSWIDTADANPVKQLPKYDTEKLKGLTAKMGGALSATAAPMAPAKAKGKPATPPKAGKKGLPTTGPVVPPVVAPVAPPVAPLTATPPPVGAPVIVPPAPSTPPPPVTAEVLTKETAWAAVNSISGVSEEQLATVWISEGSKIGKVEDQFTSDDWKTVKDAVIALTKKF